jgi:hypothetical protein
MLKINELDHTIQRMSTGIEMHLEEAETVLALEETNEE